MLLKFLMEKILPVEIFALIPVTTCHISYQETRTNNTTFTIPSRISKCLRPKLNTWYNLPRNKLYVHSIFSTIILLYTMLPFKGLDSQNLFKCTYSSNRRVNFSQVNLLVTTTWSNNRLPWMHRSLIDTPRMTWKLYIHINKQLR